MSMQRVNDGQTASCQSAQVQDEGVTGVPAGPTLPVSGVPRVDVEGLLTLSDGSSQG